MDAAEFRRWYWTMAELQPFARQLGIPAAGPKAALMDRISARLSGIPLPTDDRPTAGGQQLSGPLTRETVIPPGQRSTQALRSFFEQEIGSGFTFNGHLRAFVRVGGATLGDAIEHWHETLGSPLPEQSKSLEFNRFTKAWHIDNPDGTAAECRAAWARHRSVPVDER